MNAARSSAGRSRSDGYTDVQPRMSEALPRTLGRYQLLSLLGEGGMGKVYRGFDSVLNRGVAIKLLPAELVASPARLSRFVQEARAASALNHPNIVTVYDIGEDRLEGDEERVRYIAMELVEGQTLRDVAGTERLDLRFGLKIAVQIADGLAAAHAVGIIHRDLTPDNIVINASGVAKVLDFGLAKLHPRAESSPPEGSGAKAPASEPGMIIGTVGYMSPEQVRGDRLDARSDIFSLGCLLYEIATGRRAFDGGWPVETLYKVVHSEPVPVREIRSDLPPELWRIVRKALAKDRDERYPSAAEVAVDLRDLLRELGSNGSGAFAPAGVSSRVRREKRFALAAIAVSLAGLVAIAFLLGRRPRAQGSALAAESIQISRLTPSAKSSRPPSPPMRN
jgi:serine/threonine protein kinase